MQKRFKLKGKQIQRMIPELGAALATDRITVEGRRVDYMVRHTPVREGDSGWIFYGGDETQDYIENPDNTSVFNLNTICNYDPDIIPFLTYPPGTEIERKPDGHLHLLTPSARKPLVELLQPVEPGKVRVGRRWKFEVSSRLMRRRDEASLVLWKPGLTIWANLFAAKSPDREARVAEFLKLRSSDSFALQRHDGDELTKFRYELVEHSEEREQSGVTVVGVEAEGDIVLSIYFDRDDCRQEIDLIWRTLELHPVSGVRA